MVITRKTVEHVFILWVGLNGLFDFCNRQKIMFLGEGRSLTGLFELAWYLTPNVAVASQTLFVCLFRCYLLVKNFFNYV